MPETSFMWLATDNVFHGANIDPVTQIVKWYDDAVPCMCGKMVACGCVKSTVVQSFEQFRQDGPFLKDTPDDVLTKIHKAAAEKNIAR